MDNNKVQQSNIDNQLSPTIMKISQDVMVDTNRSTDDTEITEKLSDLSVDGDGETIAPSSEDKGPKTPREVFDIDVIIENWTPENHRDRRTKESKSIVQTTLGGNTPLVGGSFITDGSSSVTLTFCFEAPEGSPYAGRRFGLTVGHIVEDGRCGQPMYAYSSNIPDGNGKYPSKKIGTVVDVEPDTDSLLFEIDDEVKVELNTIRTSHGTKHVLDLSAVLMGGNRRNRERGRRLFGFGPQRRGTVGRVASVWPGLRKSKRIIEGDIGIDSFDPDENESDGNRAITHDSECGMIYVNEIGIGVSMHHVISRSLCGKYWTSWGVPLYYIMLQHGEYFGIKEATPDRYETCNWQASSPQEVALPIAGPQGSVVPISRRECSFSPGQEPSRREQIVVEPGRPIHSWSFRPGEEPDLLIENAKKAKSSCRSSICEHRGVED